MYSVYSLSIRAKPALIDSCGVNAAITSTSRPRTRALAEVQETVSAPVGVDPVAVEGRAADAILGQSDDAQLIVVGTHGKGLVRRALLGSVSRQILNDAARPVAIVDLPEGT